jgi:hypothetical protein
LVQQQLFAYFRVVVIGNDDHCGEPVCDVGHLVEGAPLDSLAEVGDEVIEALVRAFLAADELDDLHIGVCRALNVLFNLLDDEIGFSEVVRVKPLSV